MTLEMSDLRIAVENCDLEWAATLLCDGANPNESNDKGFTLLHHAIDIEVCSWKGHLRTPMTGEMVKLLLEAGANPLGRDEDGRNALEFAKWYGDTVAAAILDEFLNGAAQVPEDGHPAPA
jgi:ankyrin repeat protein